MRLSIDGDIIVYRAAFACQRKDEPLEPVQNALANAKSLIHRILFKFDITSYKLFLTASNDDTSFRKKLYPEYKANRGPKPEHYDAVRQYLIDIFGAEIIKGHEADDALAWHQYKYFYTSPLDGYEECSACICTIDKDLDIVPGWHFNFIKDKVYFITQIEGYRNFYKQMLVGDKADNIPRIKKGWKCKEAFNKLDDSNDEYKMFDIVFETTKDLMTEDDVFTLNKDVIERLEIRGQLLWPTRDPNDSWKVPILLST